MNRQSDADKDYFGVNKGLSYGPGQLIYPDKLDCL